MNNIRHGHNRVAGARAGFSLVELLAVVAVVLILLSLLMPLWRVARLRAERAVCLKNVGQLSNTWVIQATGNNGRMRIDLNTGGRWLWDIDIATMDMFTKEMGVPRRSFFCPSMPQQNNDYFWYYQGGYRIIGYWCAVLRADESFQPHPGWPDMADPQRDEYTSNLTGRISPGKKVLFADATPSPPPPGISRACPAITFTPRPIWTAPACCPRARMSGMPTDTPHGATFRS
jgi:prepilin-type N-terminal cleavage/methylation domain-containing protein